MSVTLITLAVCGAWTLLANAGCRRLEAGPIRGRHRS